MDNKILKLFEEERAEYFANCLKLGMKVSDIKEALEISDEDYKTIYPLALKMFNNNKAK